MTPAQALSLAILVMDFELESSNRLNPMPKDWLQDLTEARAILRKMAQQTALTPSWVTEQVGGQASNFNLPREKKRGHDTSYDVKPAV